MPYAVMVTLEPSTRGGEEKIWNYYIDIAAVLDYPQEHHAKTEDGDEPYSDGSSDEGSLGFDQPLGFMGNFGFLCDSERCMEMSVDHVGPNPLSRQRHVPQEHPPDVRWIHGLSPRTYPVTPSFGQQFLTMVKI